jgi:hypothetical protein
MFSSIHPLKNDTCDTDSLLFSNHSKENFGMELETKLSEKKLFNTL